jgi:hypothetical protein
MRKHLKAALPVILTAIVTFLVTSYFVARNVRSAMVAATIDMEAFNDIHRITTWDSLEQFLTKGCNKEALEHIRILQSLELLSLQRSLENGAKLDKTLEEQHSTILARAKSAVNNGKYYIPTCK